MASTKRTNAERHDAIAEKMARRNHRHIDKEEEQIGRALLGLGFTLTETGGGCTAYEKPMGEDGTILITAQDPTHPTRWDEEARISLWDGDSNMVANQSYPTLRNAVDELAKILEAWRVLMLMRNIPEPKDKSDHVCSTCHDPDCNRPEGHEVNS